MFNLPVFFHLEKRTSKLCPAHSKHVTWSGVPQTDGETKGGEENEGRRERKEEPGSRGQGDTCPLRKAWSLGQRQPGARTCRDLS